MNAKTYILYGLPWLLLIDRYSHIHYNCKHIGRQCYLKTPHCCMVIGERRTYTRRKWSGLVIGRHISYSRLLQSHFELPANSTHFYGVLIFFVLLPTPFSPLPRMTSSIQRPQLWLRCETKPFEQRAVLTPTIALKLIDAGFEIFVEGDEQRIFDDIECEKCVISSYPLIMCLELTQFFLVCIVCDICDSLEFVELDASLSRMHGHLLRLQYQ